MAAIGQARHESARVYAERLLALAGRIDNPGLASLAHTMLGTSLLTTGALVPARAHLEQAMAQHDVERDRPLGVLFGADPWVAGSAYLSTVLWVLGYADQALQRSQEAVTKAVQLDDPSSLATARVTTILQRLLRRQYDTPPETISAQEARLHEVPLAQVQEWATLLRGRTRARQGAFEEGLDLMRHGLAAWRSTGSLTTVPTQYCVAVHTCLEEGRPDSGLALVQEALELAEKRGLRCFLPEFVRLKGELLLQRGDVAVGAAAEACFAQALEAARPQGARTWELRAAMSMARLWQRYGRCEDARALLAGVYDWFTEGFDTPDLRDARALLAELSGAGGETHPYPAHCTG
jgi:predicted ATPase